MKSLKVMSTAMAVGLLSVTTPSVPAFAQAPTRLSDDQVERLLERIEKSADKFRESVDDALDKSRADDSKLEKDINRFVQITSTAPAKLFGMYPKKGTIAPGSDADIVIFDPDKEVTFSHKTLHMRADYTPYEGRKVVGAPTHVFSRGNLVVEGEKWLGKTGAGRFVKRGELQQR